MTQSGVRPGGFDAAALSHSSRAVAVFMQPCGVLAAVDRAATAARRPAAARKPPRPRKPRQEIDGGWPRDYQTPSGGAIRVFQPQVASWDGQRRMVAYAAVSYTATGAAKPALGTVKIEADTIGRRRRSARQLQRRQADRVALPRPAQRSAARSRRQHRRGRPQGSMVIALDRVLARLDKSQIIPKNVDGVKADPPADLLQHVAGRPRQPRWRSNLEPDQGQRPQVRRQHQLGSVRAHRHQDVLPPQRPELAERHRHQGTVEAGRQAAGSFTTLPADDNWKDVKAAVPGEPLPPAPPEGLRQHDAGGADSAARRAELPGRRAARRCSG